MRLKRDTFQRLCAARELLREEQEEALSVPEVARAVAISPFHFIRLFEALFGATPSRYRSCWRIERAKELLALGERSVTEVCMEVGFSSLGSFSAWFKKRAGVSPSIYQRHARGLARAPGALPPELIPGCLSLMGRLPPAAFRNFREA